MATQESDIEEVKRALTAKKKNFTRQYAGKITQFASTNPSPSAAAAVTAAKERVTRAYGEALDVLDDLFIRDEEHEDAYNATLTDIQGRFDDMELRFLATLKDCEPPRPSISAPPTASGNGTNAAAAGPAAPRVRIMDSLKPCLLYTSPSPRDKRQSRMPSSA